MKKKIIVKVLLIGMLGLAACGTQEATDNEESLKRTETSQETRTSQETETSQEAEYPSSYINWLTIQQDLISQNLKYIATYTYTMERLNVTVEDGTEMIFLHIPDEGVDETDMWTDYKEREQEMYALVMKNDEFYGDIFRKYYLRESERDPDSYYQPDASNLWGEITAYSLGQTGLSISRNQIFAKYGREFQDPFLDAVFREKSWYEPKYSAEEFVEGKVYSLTETEQENLQLILKMEANFRGRKSAEAVGKGAVPIASGSWVDLDGDGTVEQFFYSTKEEDIDFSTVTVTVQSEGSEVSFEETYPNPDNTCYLVNVEGMGNLLAIGMDGISADYQVELLSYQDNQLKNIGSILTPIIELVIDGKILIGNVESYHLQCQPLEREYVIMDNQVVEMEKDYYEYRENTVTVLKSIPIYAEQGATSYTDLLQEGERVTVLGGDLKEWVLLERTATGEECWIKVIGHDCYLLDGAIDYSGNIFEGLTFYG